jgi:hypothetical protein
VVLGYGSPGTHAALARLGSILNDGGSVYYLDVQEVPVEQRYNTFRIVASLQRRTAPEAVSSLHDMTRQGLRGAEELRAAWESAYGRNPDPEKAYNKAIKAVEDAVIPLVSPKDKTATFGKVLGEMRTHPEKWHVVFSDEVPTARGVAMAPIEVILTLTALLWENHTDRHGGPEKRPVTQAQAEMAVQTALFLVQVFNRTVTPTSAPKKQ